MTIDAHVAPELSLELGRLLFIKSVLMLPNEPVDKALARCHMAYQPRDLVYRIFKRRDPQDGVSRETFMLPVEAARLKAREILKQLPQGGYLTIVDHWQQQPDGQIEFTIRRLRTESE